MKKILLLVLIITSNIFCQQIYDLRDVNGINYVTPVKTQQGGTCWTHGTMSSIESNLIMNGTWQNDTGPDLAEYHLDWWNGFNTDYNADLGGQNSIGLDVHYGGDYHVATAYISRGDGPIVDPGYNTFDSAPSQKSASYQYYYVRDIEWYQIENFTMDLLRIKNAIRNNGAIGTCMYVSGEYMENFVHLQPSTSFEEPNHSIAIVGWNDTLSTGAKFPGAWLCKNSWGEDWGLEGFFYISYYDKHAGYNPDMGAVSFRNSEPMQYANVYYHDYHGWRDTFPDIKKAYNRFVGERSEILKAVSFFTCDDQVSCTIEIYGGSNSNHELTELLSSQTAYVNTKGFHTIDLDETVELHEGDDFYVMVEVSNGGQAYDRTSIIPVLLGANANANEVPSVAEPGQSYYFEDGIWKDLTDYNETANFCMKALTVAPSALEDKDVEIPIGFSLKQNYPNPFNPSTTIEFTLSNNEEVSLIVYDMLGRVVANLIDERKPAGKHAVVFNAENLSSGMYFYKLTTNSFTESKKMILMK